MSQRTLAILIAAAWAGLILFAISMLQGCASEPRNIREAIEDLCDDDDCPPTPPTREFFRRYEL